TRTRPSSSSWGAPGRTVGGALRKAHERTGGKPGTILSPGCAAAGTFRMCARRHAEPVTTAAFVRSSGVAGPWAPTVSGPHGVWALSASGGSVVAGGDFQV